jgi:hypothetical protein
VSHKTKDFFFYATDYFNLDTFLNRVKNRKNDSYMGPGSAVLDMIIQVHVTLQKIKYKENSF